MQKQVISSEIKKFVEGEKDKQLEVAQIEIVDDSELLNVESKKEDTTHKIRT